MSTCCLLLSLSLSSLSLLSLFSLSLYIRCESHPTFCFFVYLLPPALSLSLLSLSTFGVNGSSSFGECGSCQSLNPFPVLAPQHNNPTNRLPLEGLSIFRQAASFLLGLRARSQLTEEIWGRGNIRWHRTGLRDPGAACGSHQAGVHEAVSDLSLQTFRKSMTNSYFLFLTPFWGGHWNRPVCSSASTATAAKGSATRRRTPGSACGTFSSLLFYFRVYSGHQKKA